MIFAYPAFVNPMWRGLNGSGAMNRMKADSKSPIIFSKP